MGDPNAACLNLYQVVFSPTSPISLDRKTTEKGMEGLRYNADDQERYRGTGSAMPEDVVHLTFVVSDAS